MAIYINRIEIHDMESDEATVSGFIDGRQPAGTFTLKVAVQVFGGAGVGPDGADEGSMARGQATVTLNGSQVDFKVTGVKIYEIKAGTTDRFKAGEQAAVTISVTDAAGSSVASDSWGGRIQTDDPHIHFDRYGQAHRTAF